MSDEMRVSPQSLMTAAQQIARCAQDFGNEVNSLNSTVTTGNPWGQDEQGSLFGALYVAVLNHALEAYGSHVDQLGVAAKGLAGWAIRMEQTEEDLHRRIAAVGGGAGV